jgi:hypothetical protein
MNKLLEVNRELREIPDPRIRNSFSSLNDFYQALASTTSRKSWLLITMIEKTLKRLLNT